MILPGETEAGTAGTQPCRGISRRAHRDDERGVRARSHSRLYIELSSTRAANLKRHYEEISPARRAPRLVQPPPSERIATQLRRIDEGNSEEWSWLTKTLTLEKYSEFYGDEGDDLRKLPGWVESDTSTHQHIASAAKKFVTNYRPAPVEYSQHTFGHWIIAAYLAFTLLYDLDIPFLESRDQDFWNRWTGLLLAYRFDHSRGVYRNLLSLVAKRHPIALTNGLTEVLTPELVDCSFLARLQDVWTPEIQNLLMEAVKSEALNCECSETILNLLLDQGSQEAEELAKSRATDASNPDRQVRAAVALLKHSTTGAQDCVWPLIQSSDELGKRIVEAASDFGAGPKAIRKWSDQAVGNLFIWIAKRYPYQENSGSVGGAVAVGTSETVRYLRDSLLTYLRNRGSAESVAALQRAGRELGADWMNWHVADAKNVGFRIAWNPITPSELLLLASARNRPNTWAANSLLVVALTVLINVLTGLITPSALHVQTKAFLVIGTILAILALIEPMYEARRSLLPLWIILLAADAAGYAIFRYFSA